MVVEVSSHAWHVECDVNPKLLQKRRFANPTPLEDLWRVNRTSGEDNLQSRLDGIDLRAGYAPILHRRGLVAFRVHDEPERLMPDKQIIIRPAVDNIRKMANARMRALSSDWVL
jgi:hypothetical protein